MDILTASVVTAGITVGIGTLSTGIGQGVAVNGAMQGISRQPEASGTIGTNLIIGLAFIESLTIYALVVALILLFANPYAKVDKKVLEARQKIELLQLEQQVKQLEAGGTVESPALGGHGK